MYNRKNVKRSVGMVMLGPNIRVGQQIGSGNFGELRVGRNELSNELVAVKMERLKAKPALLGLEYDFYKQLAAKKIIPGIPRVHYFGACGATFNAMVIDLLGPSLEDLFDLCKRKFSLKTVLMIAKQLLIRIEYVHSRKIVFRDVKGENFLIGRKSLGTDKIIYIIDFGMANQYIDKKGNHIPFQQCRSVNGTPRYLSINAHMGKEQSRRDDLEALGYLLLYFLKGKLPWQGIDAYDATERNEKILEMKMDILLEKLCKGIPEEFAAYLRYVRRLHFVETPDYNFLRKLFQDLFESNSYVDDGQYDWSDKELRPSIEFDEDAFNTDNLS